MRLAAVNVTSPSQRTQVVQQMTRVKNRIHSILHANLIPPYRGRLIGAAGRAWLEAQPLAPDEKLAIQRYLADLDHRARDLTVLDQALAERALQDERVRRLMTIGGVHMTVAVGVLAAIGDIARFSSPHKLVLPRKTGEPLMKQEVFHAPTAQTLYAGIPG
jgi:transposase